MNFKNEIMIITYADSMGKNLKELYSILIAHFKHAVKGVHILPFFPSSADRGFAPLTYEEIDPQFGDWEDLHTLSTHFYLMYDFMANHISKSSEYFKDYQAHKDQSPYQNLFIEYRKFWSEGAPSQKQIDMIYKRKPRAPYIDVTFADGSTEKVWCTFSDEQIDLNIDTDVTKDFFRKSLTGLCDHQASIIRVDAFAYVTKKENTNCFFVEPDVWEALDYINSILKEKNVVLLPEIHEHYSMQLKIAEQGYYTYDFILPMLVLHALYAEKNHNLIHWLTICPRKQFTTLDTHDGIGVVDVMDVMAQEEIEFTKEKLFSEGASVKRVYNSAKYGNLDVYQINCTYYSALGNRDDAYLLARAIQFYTPGIPQVYYVGLLAGSNDVSLVERTKNGRDINRHNYSKEEIEIEIQRPIVQKLLVLMKFRNNYHAFDGTLTINSDTEAHILSLTWTHHSLRTILHADLNQKCFTITYYDTTTQHMVELIL